MNVIIVFRNRKKGGKPVVPETHLKIKWFFGCMSVTDQQKGNNAAHLSFQ